METPKPAAASRLRAITDKDLAEAATYFHQQTGHQLDTFNLLEDEILQKLQNKYEPSKPEDRSEKKKAIEYAKVTLKCLAKIGQVGIEAAKAASAVYPPAELCVNAVAFIVNIPDELEDYYSRFAEMFREISHFLPKFKIYEDIERAGNMRDDLVKHVKDVTCKFIKLCAMAYHPFKKGTKLRQLGRKVKYVIFKDDSGAKEMLDEFVRACQIQDSLSGAITLEMAFKTSKDLQRLIEEQSKDRKVLLDTDRRVNVLADMLTQGRRSEEERRLVKRLSDDFLSLDYEEDVRSQKTRLGEINRQRLRAGEWLADWENYQNWLNPNTLSAPLLYLFGERSTGKTNLIPSILHDIYKLKRDRTVHVAWVFFDYDHEHESDFASTNKEGRNFDTVLSIALRSMAVQLAESSGPYLKFIMSHFTDATKPHPFENGFREVKCDDLFDELKFSSWRNDRSDQDTAVYLIFDGLQPHNSTHAMLSRIASATASSCEPKDSANVRSKSMTSGRRSSTLRVLVTGSEEISPIQKDINIARVDICGVEPESISANAVDIRHYIADVVNGDCDLQYIREKKPELFAGMVTDLVKISRGNFSIVKTKLDRMKELINTGLQDPQELKDIANDTPDGDEGILANTVLTELNSKLIPIDIRQINHVLKWIMYSNIPITFKTLDAIINLEPDLALLQEFSHKVKTRPLYKKLLDITSYHGRVKLQENISIELAKRGEASLSDSGSLETPGSSISMDITMSLKDVDRSDVRRFFWDLSERATFRQFDFGHVNRMNIQTEVININRCEATATVIIGCLDILNGDKDCREPELLKNTVHALPTLLIEAKMLAEKLSTRRVILLFPRKREIITKLLHMLENPVKFVDLFRNRKLSKSWMSSDSVAAMSWWMSVDNVKDLSGPEKARLIAFLNENADIGGFLTPLIKEMACKWLVEEGWWVVDAYEWIDGYLTLNLEEKDTRIREDHQIDRPRKDVTGSGEEERRIVQALGWVREFVLPESKYPADSTWYLRLARTYMWKRIHGPAMDNFVCSLEAPRCNVARVRRYMAMAWAERSNYQHAIEQMTLSLQAYEDMDDKQLSPEDLAHYKQGQMDLAKWYTYQESPEKAFAYYEKIIKRNPYNYAAHVDYLTESFKLYEHDTVTRLFVSLRGNRELGQRDRLADCLRHAANNPNHHRNWNRRGHHAWDTSLNSIVSAAYSTNNLQMVEEALDVAQKAPALEGSIERALLLWARGTAHFYRNRHPGGDLIHAVRTWEEAMRELADVAPLRKKPADMRRLHRIGRQCSLYYHLKGQKSDHDRKEIEGKLKGIYESVQKPIDNLPLTRGTFLAHYYACNGRLPEARGLLRQSMQDAFELLTDESPENDWDGYSKMARVLKATGDRANALAAFSLIRPYAAQRQIFRTDTNPTAADGIDHDSKEKSNEADGKVHAEQSNGTHGQSGRSSKRAFSSKSEDSDGPLHYVCSGIRCKRKWTHANELWICEVCPDAYFCHKCYAELRACTGAFTACHPEHAHVFVPAWSDDELRKVGRRRVRIPDDTDDKQQTHRKGRCISIHEWLKEISRTWEIPFMLENEAVDGEKTVTIPEEEEIAAPKLDKAPSWRTRGKAFREPTKAKGNEADGLKQNGVT